MNQYAQLSSTSCFNCVRVIYVPVVCTMHVLYYKSYLINVNNPFNCFIGYVTSVQVQLTEKKRFLVKFVDNFLTHIVLY